MQEYYDLVTVTSKGYSCKVSHADENIGSSWAQLARQNGTLCPAVPTVETANRLGCLSNHTVLSIHT